MVQARPNPARNGYWMQRAGIARMVAGGANPQRFGGSRNVAAETPRSIADQHAANVLPIIRECSARVLDRCGQLPMHSMLAACGWQWQVMTVRNVLAHA
jgi:hypothetical protein